MAIGEKLLFIGMVVLFIGIILIVAGGFAGSTKSEKVKSAGIIFIGPFPIGWASDKKMFYGLLGITILMIILWILFGGIKR